jgi:hypothetical protein
LEEGGQIQAPAVLPLGKLKTLRIKGKEEINVRRELTKFRTVVLMN